MLDSSKEIHHSLAPSELILREDGSVYHLGIKAEHLADTVIIVGDPDRVDLISSYFDTISFTNKSREFSICTGTLNATSISVLSTGIGVDNIDIVLNELDAAVNIDPKTRMPRAVLRKLRILRLGTSGSLHENAPIGSFVGTQMAIGMEGLPYHYRPKFEKVELEGGQAFKEFMNWPSQLAKPYMVNSGEELFQIFDQEVVHGITLTANGFYAPQGRSLRLENSIENYHDKLRSFSFQGIPLTNFEMECSGVYALSSMLGHDAFTICVILADRSGKQFHSDPHAAVVGLVEMALHRLTT